MNTFSYSRRICAISLAVLLVQTGADAQQAISLMDPAKPAMGWTFNNGPEFPGAKGEAVNDSSIRQGGRDSLKVSADFQDGGKYVQVLRKIDGQDIRELSFWIRNLTTDAVSLRVIDGADRCHQFRLKAETSEGWQRIVFPLEQFFANQSKPTALTSVLKYEAWGGDKKKQGWTAPAKMVAILFGKSAGAPVRDVWINGFEVLPPAPQATLFEENFDDSSVLEGWSIEAASVAKGDAFSGTQALVLEKKQATLRDTVSARTPVFAVAPGALNIGFAARSDLESMDNSYNGTLEIAFLDNGNKVAGQTELTSLFRKNNWKVYQKQLTIPENATNAQIIAKINKETPGRFWIDDLSVRPVAGPQKDDSIRQLKFTTAQIGNLLFPGDPKVIFLELLSTRPLSENERTVRVVIHDYWGAEQADPLPASLQEGTKKGNLLCYQGEVDFSKVNVEIGRYYEVHGFVGNGKDPYTNYSAFAILPEAAANAYKPEELPFVSRTWDNRVEDYVKLVRRLGIRICGLAGRMDSDPAKVTTTHLELASKLGMGFMTGSQGSTIERRAKGYELLTEESMRQAVRNYIEKTRHVRPMVVTLGNEPHSKGEEVKKDVEAYRIIYTEIKKVDPSIFVVGTSIGPTEDYFKAGFGQWCDAYDFHVYEDALSVRDVLTRRYPELFRKYGLPKPIWSTELGLNSQGMSRHAVAIELYRKFANFFAGGGACVAWFGFLYPDPEGKHGDSFASAHNVFDCRYSYSPKLDAIAYYNAVNAIAIKKYVEDRTYGKDMHAFLFRDREGKALQIWYKDKGREEVFVPMNGVQEVQLIRIDGTRETLSAEGNGITLTINEDPVLLLYSGESALPPAPGEPEFRLGNTPGSIVRGTGCELEITGGKNGVVSLKAPPFWQVTELQNSSTTNVTKFAVKVPDASAVREADLTFSLTDQSGKKRGQIYYRPSVTGMTSIQLLPSPAAGANPPAVKLVVSNNGSEKQQVSWDVSLTGEQELKDGKFTEILPAAAYFKEAASGTVEVPGNQSKEILLPLSDADLTKVYRARATARDSSGRTVTEERPVSAFYGVTRATEPITIDGTLDESSWRNASERMLDSPNSFFAFPARENKPAGTWQGPEDLSARIRYLWDDRYLYLAVEVQDDIAGNLRQDDSIWSQDGLQFLIDPMRTSKQKAGKYDYALGVGKKGTQVWCYLSGDSSVPGGEVKEFQIATRKTKENTGSLTYEIAIPWTRLAPFKPSPGANLGFTMILNEDDGAGRDSFMTWFGNAHNKDVDTVGDLLLLDATP